MIHQQARILSPRHTHRKRIMSVLAKNLVNNPFRSVLAKNLVLGSCSMSASTPLAAKLGSYAAAILLQQIHYWLQEVKTPAGQIDRLTGSEIIEVKRVSEWKSGLGQILLYSSFYPGHRKRLRLFGSAKDKTQIPKIVSSCLSFDVFVSFEIVGVEE